MRATDMHRMSFEKLGEHQRCYDPGVVEAAMAVSTRVEQRLAALEKSQYK